MHDLDPGAGYSTFREETMDQLMQSVIISQSLRLVSDMGIDDFHKKVSEEFKQRQIQLGIPEKFMFVAPTQKALLTKMKELSNVVKINGDRIISAKDNQRKKELEAQAEKIQKKLSEGLKQIRDTQEVVAKTTQVKIEGLHTQIAELTKFIKSRPTMTAGGEVDDMKLDVGGWKRILRHAGFSTEVIQSFKQNEFTNRATGPTSRRLSLVKLG